jgi:spermidine synthase
MLFKNKILDQVDSSLNGKIEVVKSLVFGTSISIGGLTQSGGIVYEIWNKTLKRIKKQKPNINKCLILGLGGGSVAKVIKKYWENINITGVEIDKNMIILGTKYLGLEDIKTEINDAYEFSLKESKSNNRYDLVIVDLYIGDKFPDKFQNLELIKALKKIIRKEGLIIFNRLYYGEKRKEALNFAKKLESMFKKVEYYYPEANLMLICTK